MQLISRVHNQRLCWNWCDLSFAMVEDHKNLLEISIWLGVSVNSPFTLKRF